MPTASWNVFDKRSGRWAGTQDEEGREQFRVIVIASISGGTGGGCFADLGLSIRQILREERMERAAVEGVMIVAPGMRKEQRELAQANAYVTLSELRYYLDPNCRFPGVKALGLRRGRSGPIVLRSSLPGRLRGYRQRGGYRNQLPLAGRTRLPETWYALWADARDSSA